MRIEPNSMAYHFGKGLVLISSEFCRARKINGLVRCVHPVGSSPSMTKSQRQIASHRRLVRYFSAYGVKARRPAFHTDPLLPADRPHDAFCSDPLCLAFATVGRHAAGRTARWCCTPRRRSGHLSGRLCCDVADAISLSPVRQKTIVSAPTDMLASSQPGCARKRRGQLTFLSSRR